MIISAPRSGFSVSTFTSVHGFRCCAPRVRRWSWRTAPRGSRPAARTARCWRTSRISSWTACSWPQHACGLAETARIAGYLAGEVAGQCGPCVNGLPRLAGTLGDLAHHRARAGLPAEVRRLAALVTGRGACRHPDGTARMIMSAMSAFDADVAAHLAGRCLATGSAHQGVRR